MRVVIKSCCLPNSWYKDKIGWVYEVKPIRGYSGGFDYVLSSDLGRGIQRIIDPIDFVEVDEDKIPQVKRGEL